MINEEVSGKILHITNDCSKNSSKFIINKLQKLLSKLKKNNISLNEYVKLNGNEVKLKEIVAKGQVEELQVKSKELVELKKELNRFGVNFSVVKDKTSGNHSVFFEAKNLKVMEKAFKIAIMKVNAKQKQKSSIIKQINKFKSAIKQLSPKFKIRNKNREQSL